MATPHKKEKETNNKLQEQEVQEVKPKNNKESTGTKEVNQAVKSISQPKWSEGKNRKFDEYKDWDERISFYGTKEIKDFNKQRIKTKREYYWLKASVCFVSFELIFWISNIRECTLGYCSTSTEYGIAFYNLIISILCFGGFIYYTSKQVKQ